MRGGTEVITKEWLEGQIVQLSGELDAAVEKVKIEAALLERARRDYDEALETAKTLLGCIKGMREELAFVEQGGGGICPPKP
jgi:hypothetical protein